MLLFYLQNFQPLYKGGRSWTTFETLDCRNALIGLGKNQPFFFFVGGRKSPPTEPDTATDLDLIIVAFLLTTSSSTNTFLSSWSATPFILLFCVLNNDQNSLVDLLLFNAGEFFVFTESKSLSTPENRDLDRRNGIANDRERRRAGSLSIKLDTRPVAPTPAPSPGIENRENEDEDDEDEEELVVRQEQGRTLAQSGQRTTKRSRRQIGQIPLLRRLDGCLEHFHASSSSKYKAIFLIRLTLQSSCLAERKNFCCWFSSGRFSRFLFCGFPRGNVFKRDVFDLIEGAKLTTVNFLAHYVN